MAHLVVDDEEAKRLAVAIARETGQPISAVVTDALRVGQSGFRSGKGRRARKRSSPWCTTLRRASRAPLSITASGSMTRTDCLSDH